MSVIRFLIRHRPLLAALVVTAALALRVLVPAGFMPVLDHGRIVLAICAGAGDGPGALATTMPGHAHGQPPADLAQGKCAYADLAQAMTGGVDPILLLAALAFVMMLALAGSPVLPPRPPARLRPPLRGPPRPA